MKKRTEEISRIKSLPDIRIDPHADERGVLLSDEIEFYVQHGRLIEPFCKENLKPAGYELTVGNEAMLGGAYIHLDDDRSRKLRIPPFEVAVIKTGEMINLPRFLIARWNIRVAWAYKGLLWVGGPQVDPGYAGHLFCPLYNLSDRDVWITKGHAIALMDFVKTTTFRPQNSGQDVGGSKEYRRPPKRVVMDDYEIEDFRSALFSHGKEVQEGLRTVQRRVDFFILIVFAVIAILVAAVAIPSVGGGGRDWNGHWLVGLSLMLSSVAFMVSLLAMFLSKGRIKRHWTYFLKKRRWLSVLIAFLGGVIAALVTMWIGERVSLGGILQNVEALANLGLLEPRVPEPAAVYQPVNHTP